MKAKVSQPTEYGLQEGQFGVPDLMVSGLTSAKSRLENDHPIEQSELNVSFFLINIVLIALIKYLLVQRKHA